MKITVNRLRHILQLTQPSVGAKSMTITNFLLLKEGYAVANNLETAVAVELKELGEEETFLINHKLITDSLKTRPGNALLDITIEDDSVVMKCQNPAFTITHPVRVPDDFPDFPIVDQEDGGEVDGDVLVRDIADMLKYTAIIKDRPLLAGICFDMGEVLVVGAADGFRIAWRDIPVTLKAAEGQSARITIPAKSIKVLAQLWKNVEKRPRQQGHFDVEKLNGNPQLQVAAMATAKRYIQVALTESQVSFNMGEATLVSQIIKGDFPDYTQMIPKDPTHQVVFDAGEFYRALQQLAPIASAKSANNIIRMSWRRQEMTLSAGGDEGKSEATVAASIQGRASHIAFNLKYLQELLSGKEGRVLMETTTPSSPARFTHATSPNIVIMGMFVRAGAKVEAEEQFTAESPDPEGVALAIEAGDSVHVGPEAPEGMEKAECFNCSGKGVIGDKPCIVCNGDGYELVPVAEDGDGTTGDE